MSHETIKQFRLYRYSLPFRDPLPFGGRVVSERKGLFIQAEWSTGATGIGEIAPLPGWSKETLKDVLGILPGLIKRLTGANISEVLFGERKSSPLAGLPPSIVFGIESALLSTPAARKENPLFVTGETVELSINGLLNFDRANNYIDDIESARRFEIVKIKAPMSDPDALIKYLTEIRQANPQLQILLDANQGWENEIVRNYLSDLKNINIYYVEEPFGNLKDAEEFFEQSGIHYAIDEHWIANPDEIMQKIESKKLPGLRAVVVKPTLFGSIVQLESIASRLAHHGIQMVISSCFESGIGISTLSRLAYNLSPGSFAGLDTIKLFKTDILNPPLHLATNSITVYPLVSQPFSLLENFYAPINLKILEQFIDENSI